MMRNFQRISIFLIIAGLFLKLQHAYGQKIKYKDVFEMAQKGDPAVLPLLKSFLRKDSTLVSANLQLGLLLFEQSKQTDPIKQFEVYIARSDSAMFYLKRALRMVNEKEVRKNDEYYMPYRKNYKDTSKLIKDYDTVARRVKNHVVKTQTEILNRKGNLTKIYKYLSGGVNAYNQAAAIYKSINERFFTVKEFCLLATDEDLLQLKTMYQKFDSAQLYFQGYTRLVKEFPIPPYSQRFFVRSIETFRVDGLSKSDFLAQNVGLWNYSEWAKNQIQAIETDIKKLKAEVLAHDRKFNQILAHIQMGTVNPDSVLTAKLDSKFERLFNKYDYNSLGLNWLIYKQAKNNFAAFALHKYNTVENTPASLIEAKASYYREMLRYVMICDTALQKMASLDFNKEIKKYQFLLYPNFADTVSLKTYMFNEHQFVAFSTKEYSQRYMQMMCNYLQKFSDTLAYIPYNNTQLPLFRSFSSGKSEYKVTALREDKKGNIFLAGYKENQAWIAKLNEHKQVVWLKQIPLKYTGSTEWVSCIDVSETLCLAVVCSKLGDGIKNTLVKIDAATGNEIHAKFVDGNQVARHLIYDAVNDGHVVMFQGYEVNPFCTTEQNAEIVSYDQAGTPKWRNKWSMFGTCVDVVRVFEGYVGICNITKANTPKGAYVSQAGTSAEFANILVFKISTQGEWKFNYFIPSQMPSYALGIVRLNSNQWNLVAINAPFTAGNMFRKDALFPNKYWKEYTADLQVR